MVFQKEWFVEKLPRVILLPTNAVSEPWIKTINSNTN